MKRPFNNPLIQFVLLFSDDDSGTSVSGKQLIVKKLAFLKERAKRFLSSRALCALIMGIAAVGTFGIMLPHSAMAGPDQVVVDGNVATATGDQSNGIASGIDKDFLSPPVNTLNVNALSGEIEPATGTRGIDFRNRRGGNVNVHSGAAADSVAISTTGAEGIFAESLGTPPTPAAPDPFLRVRIPGDPGIDGGEVVVESYGSIMTEGDGARGISANSATTGYSQQVIDDLENFSENGFAFEVTSVENPDGTQGELGNEIAGVVIDPDTGEPLTDAVGNPITAGTFVLNSNGTYAFNPVPDPDDPDNPIKMLAPGESLQASVRYVVLGTNTNPDPDVPDEEANGKASLIVTVMREEDESLRTLPEAYFDRYGASTKPTLDSEDPGKALTVFPDLKNYVNGLLGDATAGGAGNSVTITSAGAIQTQGNEAYGIYAQTEGGSGGKGRNGSISHGSGRGGGGKKGGSIEVNVIAGGTITTSGEDSAGIIALTRGGNGGNGGNGGFWRHGARGGTGGDGGDISVDGIGTIETSGDSASGVIALSTGGDGGNGGSGSVFTGGQSGGFGGKGGTVRVEGILNITTQGEKAHGIWAKSTGGNAGAGGSGGWICGSPGGGGSATDGGSVTVSSGGAIETSGSDAFGIYGQSVGGFGGKGGAGRGIFYAAGGDGNSAGSGGAVTVTNREEGSVTTHGVRSHAIFAQSVGGGGGSGGGAGSLVALGGDAGAGGDGNSANIVNAGKLTTEGDYAYGLLAQSIGGGGGDGGSSGGLGSFGGTGSGGGDGGSVVITNAKTSVIKTTGLRSHAIIAQSIGGGDGGSSGGLVAVGGSGSDTSKGGAVTITNSGSITAASNAIFAQSIGGGGGNGGSSGGWFSIGGSGGGGGDASNVLVNNSGQMLQTSGANSSAVFAQSIGGGGGNGGNSASVGAFASLAIGGEGAAGGMGADVTVNSNHGIIDTSGNNSHGIQAQSVGGGGGNGGFAFSASVGISGSIAIGIGGKGGGGGDSGQVNVVSDNTTISTLGDDSNGIFAESIGGGGGSGGFAIAAAGSDGIGVSFAFGGKGGSGGNGKAVDVLSSGSIDTLGNRSHGIQAQSVGGGGGNGGFSVAVSGGGLGAFSLGLGGSGGGGGNSKGVTVNSYATIGTSGDSAVGLFAQSVGGGGGNGGFTVSGAGAGTGAGTFNLGGSGGGGGDSDTVLVDSYGDIITRGTEAHGLLAQSVGGGGGNGGFSITGSGAGIGSGSIGIGGFGGDGGNSKGVTVSCLGEIDTSGDKAIGLFAQSVGGGGGSGSFSISGSGAGTGSGTFNLGGDGGGGGDSDFVTVDTSGYIVTRGTEAYGILAQSVGGGGGNGGFSITGSGAGTGSGSIGIGGFAGDGGDGKAVTVNNASIIDTYGHSATGLFAQSVGGGGGTGGFSIAGSGAKTGSGTFSLGGSGGLGGHGDSVDVNNQNSISTDGELAYGIVAQSVGGGGGAGGFSFSGGVTTDGFVMSASVGGAGGAGGNAGSVSLTNDGLVTTSKNGSHAILAQSVGGGGGSGGFSGSLTASSGSKPNISISVGGAGGVAGDGGYVQLDNHDVIYTTGVASYGLFAQSVGGGGGDGGGSFAAALGSHEGGANLSVSVGGFGGAAGNAGKVVVGNDSLIITEGIKSHGIAAQSIGGGGGTGGFSATGSLSKGASAKDLAVSIGGFGGVGGDGGSVNVHNTGSIYTLSNFSGVTPADTIEVEDPLEAFNDGSIGILAQSIGGGGGNGGFSFAGSFAGSQAKNLSVSVGGSGGAGGKGMGVNVTNENTIDTTGAYSYGILAQSIGGGGGNGGASVAIDFGISDPDGANQNVAVSVGGGGGDANIGGAVDVVNSSGVTTRGYFSHGILVQSIGGGGGNGGYSLAGTISLETGKEPKQPVNVSMAIGGAGGDGSHGGTVIVDNSGTINTYQDSSIGIFAQSIGGGGGTGGGARAMTLDIDPNDWLPKLKKENINDFLSDLFSTWNLAVGGSGGGASDGGSVTIVNKGNIVTQGAESHGIFAQSVGGGGGLGGNASHGIPDVPKELEPFLELTPLKGLEDMQIVVGGSGGSSGHGDHINVNNESNIRTLGHGSSGIFVQSIGGGGGVGGSGAVGLVGKIGIGGAAGASGDGGEVMVSHDGRIDTFGAAAYGIFAQSVGGGGGMAGNVDRGLFDLGLGYSFAQSGGGGGDGGRVTVASHGDIVTNGAGANGIFAQSVGGGGGIAGDTGLGYGFAGSVGDDGSGGIVSVTHVGAISTFGDHSHGIFAQSAGGKDFGAAVTIDLTGDIMAMGDGSDGIIAQSRGDQGGGAIDVHILSGSVQGGAGAGAGVRIMDGNHNMLTNDGTLLALSGNAIIAGDGNDTVSNGGTIIGSVDLGPGANAFINRAGARFEPGSNITVGTGNQLTNAGMLSPGGNETFQTTVLAGNLVQTDSGIFEANISNTGAHDQLLVDGSVSLNGTLSVIRGRGPYFDGTRYELIEVSDPGAMIGSFSDYDLPEAKPLLSFRVNELSDAVHVIAYAPSFTTVATNPMELSLARCFDANLLSATGDWSDVLGEFQLLSESEFAEAFLSLSPSAYGNATSVTRTVVQEYIRTLEKRLGGLRMTNSGLRAQADNEPLLLAYNGSDASMGQLLSSNLVSENPARHGLWLDVFGRRGGDDESNGYHGFDYQLAGILGGFDYLFTEKLTVGVSLGYSRTDIDLDRDLGDSDISSTFWSLYSSYVHGSTYIDTALSYGKQNYKNSRLVVVGPLLRFAQSHHNGDFCSAYVEGGHVLHLDEWALSPFASLQYATLDEEGFSETGADSLNLTVDDRRTESLSSELGVRVARVIELPGGQCIPELSLSWLHDFALDDQMITAAFAGAPGSEFAIQGQELQKNGAMIGGAISIVRNRGCSISLQYSGEFRGSYSTHGLVGKVSYEF